MYNAVEDLIGITLYWSQPSSPSHSMQSFIANYLKILNSYLTFNNVAVVVCCRRSISVIYFISCGTSNTCTYSN